MTKAGSKGFDVTMTTFSTPVDYTAVASLLKNDLAQIGINVNIVPQDPVTFGANNSAGTFDWNLTGRGMRGDVDGYVAEYNPSAAIYSKWFTGWNGAPKSNPKPIWRLVGNGRITLDTAKRLPMYQNAEQEPDGRGRRDRARLGLEVLRREQAAEEHLRRVHGLQPRAADGVHRKLEGDF